jgi:hypothetical protein
MVFTSLPCPQAIKNEVLFNVDTSRSIFVRKGSEYFLEPPDFLGQNGVLFLDSGEIALAPIVSNFSAASKAG